MNRAYESTVEERRKRLRLEVELPVEVRVHGVSCSGITKAVSGNSMFLCFPVEVIRMFAPEQKIVVKLSLSRSESCRLFGRVVRIVTDDPIITNNGIGVRVTGADEEDFTTYIAFIRKHSRPSAVTFEGLSGEPL